MIRKEHVDGALRRFVTFIVVQAGNGEKPVEKWLSAFERFREFAGVSDDAWEALTEGFEDDESTATTDAFLVGCLARAAADDDLGTEPRESGD
jgi:hypothetical protein